MDAEQQDFQRRVERVVGRDGVLTEADHLGDRIAKLEAHAIKASKIFLCTRAVEVANLRFFDAVAKEMRVDVDFLRYDLGVGHIGRLHISPRSFAPHQHRIWAESGRIDDLQAVADKAYADALSEHFDTPWEIHAGSKKLFAEMMAAAVEMHQKWE